MIYMDIDASIKRFLVEFGEAESRGLIYEEFDAHADETAVPSGNLIGMSGLAMHTEHPFQCVEVMLGISFESDTNLLKLREMIAALYQRLQPTKTIDVLDWQTGVKKGILIVQDGTQILPVGGGQARPVQYVMVAFKTDCFADD